MLKVGLVGSGFMGSTHAAGWVQTPAQFVGICSADTARAGKLAAQYGTQVYNTAHRSTTATKPCWTRLTWWTSARRLTCITR